VDVMSKGVANTDTLCEFAGDEAADGFGAVGLWIGLSRDPLV
jgi:hypothetical protein